MRSIRWHGCGFIRRLLDMFGRMLCKGCVHGCSYIIHESEGVTTYKASANQTIQRHPEQHTFYPTCVFTVFEKTVRVIRKR